MVNILYRECISALQKYSSRNQSVRSEEGNRHKARRWVTWDTHDVSLLLNIHSRILRSAYQISLRLLHCWKESKVFVFSRRGNHSVASGLNRLKLLRTLDIKSRKVRLVEHVECMWKTKNAYKITVWREEILWEKSALNNIKMNFYETERERLKCAQVAQDRFRRLTTT
jgi:hypothetical protein